ncbi:DUF2062 domain-containing protein [Desulfosediminicola flagellatus]|uniref:DUF2062 domain-containing protein n=1 Tax=Desulfosediminicola flagellatus TaxID=2569541 RepID=UPI0010AD1312|nr:DUF2062 domain-containing protein [Desulfosediminicola flagellatus]
MSEKKQFVRYRSVLKWMVRLRRSPRAISGGFALGTFVAFTPTIGVQFAIVIFLATLFNMNRPAALIMIWITNAATMAPIYTFNYFIGNFFHSGPPVGEVYRVFSDLTVMLLKMDWFDFSTQFKTITNLGREIIIPLITGSIIVGLFSALIVYGITSIAIRYLIVHRNRKRLLNNPPSTKKG